jgi:hypothetical protein
MNILKNGVFLALFGSLEGHSIRVDALNSNALLTYKFIMNKVVIHLSIFEYMTYVIFHT